MSREEHNIDFVRRYLAAIERGAVGEELASYFTEDVVQHEYPNRLVPEGARRDRAALLVGAEKGQKVMGQQRFELQTVFAAGDTVACECTWSAVAKVPIGKLAIGDTMRARFGVFVTLRDGRIASQRNYDCFEPF